MRVSISGWQVPLHPHGAQTTAPAGPSPRRVAQPGTKADDSKFYTGNDALQASSFEIAAKTSSRLQQPSVAIMRR